MKIIQSKSDQLESDDISKLLCHVLTINAMYLTVELKF